MYDSWGKALLDYYKGTLKDQLILHTSFGDPEIVPMQVFFRDEESFTELERYALELCQSPVLDIGAGTGCHSLFLQQKGQRVVALEQSPGACEVMRLSGIRRIIQQDIFRYSGTGYKTALIMMNGLGLAGSLDRLARLLDRVFSWLLPGGQILADSCDVAYLYQDVLMPVNNFYGEQEYCYEYKGQKDKPFPWLYVDIDRLKREAYRVNLKVQVVFEEDDQYLVRISRF